FYSEESYLDNYLTGLKNIIRYLKHFYSLNTIKAKFSNNLTDANILKENLIIV
ncbi:hypothetical protein C8Q69DRAFT_410157, partial [Paecilomyces variotii]